MQVGNAGQLAEHSQHSMCAGLVDSAGGVQSIGAANWRAMSSALEGECMTLLMPPPSDNLSGADRQQCTLRPEPRRPTP